MKNLKKKKGFTLIELMIVLAIIAILAIVLVPKAAIFKSQAKNAGVMTNVNTVRAYLETRTGNSFESDETKLQEIINNALLSSTATDEPVVNPFTNGTSDAIKVIEKDEDAPTTKGTVVVKINSDNSYTVYGIENGGAHTEEFKIAK